MEVLFTLLADRYERGTVMLTSNLPVSKWETIFKDPMTAAAIDRLVHHSVILELNRPKGNLLSVSPPAVLMVERLIDPDFAAGVDVAGPHDDHFPGPHAT